ncbi:MAG: hypothetical protein IPN36_14965 [Bacteroidetes bacterium]|nr:hypothetical protein [Bacteroidota bacterium]
MPSVVSRSTDKDFKMDVLYYVDTIGNRLNHIPVPAQTNVYAKPLNRLFNLDKLNQTMILVRMGSLTLSKA